MNWQMIRLHQAEQLSLQLKPASYQWQKSTDGGKTFTALSDGTGITGATLSLTGLTTSDNGNIYRC